ncbi:MAG: hypothetical protein P8J32_03275 [bacterium]|jgi:hypothetical protein|nr:hypothetical protein [bacterium]
MSPWVRILLGIAVAIVGYLILKKTDMFLGWFGRIPVADQKLGPGGTRMAYKLIGMGTALMGVAIATNLITGMLQSLAGFLTNT